MEQYIICEAYDCIYCDGMSDTCLRSSITIEESCDRDAAYCKYYDTEDEEES